MYTIDHIDTCLPDYFCGHHLPTVQVAVTNTTTCQDILNELKSYQTYEHLFEDDRFETGELNDIDGFDGFDSDMYICAVETLFEDFVHPLTDVPKCCMYIEEVSEEDAEFCDMVYMYFVVDPNGE
jgi:hypothetical protein